jgi:protein transport protein SEC23
MAVALGLLEATCKGDAGRMMVFVGGPPTVGPGLVCGIELKDQMRSHQDIQKGDAKHFKKAKEFYSKVARRASANGHVIDMFVCSLDQSGVGNAPSSLFYSHFLSLTFNPHAFPRTLTM